MPIIDAYSQLKQKDRIYSNLHRSIPTASIIGFVSLALVMEEDPCLFKVYCFSARLLPTHSHRLQSKLNITRKWKFCVAILNSYHKFTFITHTRTLGHVTEK